MGAVGALHRSVELGRTWGQHEQMQPALLTGWLELGGKLGAAVDLQGANGKGMRWASVSRKSVAEAAVARS